MNNILKLHIIIVFGLALSGCPGTDNISSDIDDYYRGEGSVSYSGFVNKTIRYGEDKTTSVDCGFSSRTGQTNINIRQTNSKNYETEGVFFSFYNSLRPQVLSKLEATNKDIDVDVIVEEVDSVFSKLENDCNFSAGQFKNKLSGTFSCPKLTNSEGEAIAAHGWFECKLVDM